LPLPIFAPPNFCPSHIAAFCGRGKRLRGLLGDFWLGVNQPIHPRGNGRSYILYSFYYWNGRSVYAMTRRVNYSGLYVFPFG